MSGLNFRTRVIGAIILCQFLIAAVGLGAHMSYEYETTRQFLRESSLTFAKCMAHGCTPLVCANDEPGLERFLEIARREHSESMVYAFIQRAAAEDEYSRRSMTVTAPCLLEGGPQGADFEIAVPITQGDQRAGTLRIGVSDARVKAHMISVGMRGTMLVIFALVAGGALAFLVDRRLRKSLGELTRTTEAMAQGNLDVRADIRTRDELQRLGDAFNTMAARLASARDDLEKTVARRTRELESERQKLSAIVSSVGAAILLLDEDYRIRWANSVAHEWFGPSLVDKPCSLTLFAADQPCAHCPSRRTRQSGRIERSEHTVGVNGARRFYEVVASPIRDASGRIRETLELIQDITEKKRIEAQLLQAGKLVAMGELAAGIAHEINNPLAIISAHSERMRELLARGDAVRLTGCAEAVEKQAFRCKEIINKLLAFARQKEYEPRPTRLNRVIEEALALVAHQAKMGGKTIKTLLAPDIPLIESDPEGLQQVFVNLLTNAIDAIDEKGEIQIRTVVAEHDVIASVQDTGTGIRPHDRPRIFEPFFTTKPPGKGTGLGLAICARIVARVGGRIDVTSAEGQGSTFSVRLPIRRFAG